MRRAGSRQGSRSGRAGLTDVVNGAIAGAFGVWVMDQVGWALYRRENPQALRQELVTRDVYRAQCYALQGVILDLVMNVN